MSCRTCSSRLENPAVDTDWDPTPEDFNTLENIDFSDDSPNARAYRKAWARLLSKVYEIDPVVCPKCGSEMKVIAIIQEPAEIDRILRYPGCRVEQQPKAATRLVKQGRPPTQVFEQQNTLRIIKGPR